MKRRESDNRLSAIMTRHIKCYLESTGIATEKFARERVIPALIAAGELTEPTTEVEKWYKSQSRRLVRYIDGENHPAINWIFPLIYSLPAEYQQPLKNELCGALGSFFVALTAMAPRSQNHDTRSHLPQMAKEWGDILIQSNPAMDGVFSADDDPVELMNYANEITECIGILMAELGAIYRATGIEPASVKAYRNSTLFD
ncbi:hypothetical protein SAMN04488136_1588 [Vibrio xiamenensis]|uniref:Uncharacterized protein n=1 Tax=Vibrio xiamenensis TaxID=861298 RepID=A0A1G8HPK9_9VIBR|nr:hypothetical protein [Vibrio xiamenensis]SDI08512.1 hypothetical protein SAMN04488136_1588 [Vibrio xiamenensis]